MNESGEKTLEQIMSSPEPEECEVLADGRRAHFLTVDLNGAWKCERCPATVGKHGFMRADVA